MGDSIGHYADVFEQFRVVLWECYQRYTHQQEIYQHGRNHNVNAQKKIAGNVTSNDADGDYGSWPGVLPSGNIRALQFQGLASAPSTTNAADYSLTSGGAVFTNNEGVSGTVQPSGPLPCPADCSNGDGSVNVTDLLALLAAWGQVGSACDLAGDTTVNVTDLLALLAAWGGCP